MRTVLFYYILFTVERELASVRAHLSWDGFSRTDAFVNLNGHTGSRFVGTANLEAGGHASHSTFRDRQHIALSSPSSSSW
ncbi:hypothetical protein F5Y10DRAFT_163271 [Nemania abortiva]|nr:hypothetical protein F5Y10DRAFT_163271 [Nemania abortiva]